MKKSILILITLTTGLFCAGQSSKSSSDSAYTGNLDSAYTGNLDSVYLGNLDSINTKYEYTESNGARLIIQNSFPERIIYYTDPKGKKYTCAVFATRIINETFDSLELTIDFPLDSLEIPSSSGNYYTKLLLSSDPFNDYSTFLDNNRYKSSSLKRTINTKGISTFYVVALFNLGTGGVMRAGLSLKEQYLFYRINDKEIACGKMNLKNLRLSN